MSEQRQQSSFVPLRIRFRSPAEQAQWERDHVLPPTYGDSQALQAPSADVATDTDIDAQRRTRQVKELLRLSNIVREDLGLSELLQQIVASTSVCTGFRVLVVHLIENGSEMLSPSAFVGISEENINILRTARRPVEQILRLLRPEFRISQSYFISHEYMQDISDMVSVINKRADDHMSGGWHPDDTLIVPLYSPRKKQLLGFLTLNDPEDGKLPTVASIEVAELFANQAAIAIDNVRILQEKEAEAGSLDKAVASLLGDLEQIQRGDLRVRIQSTHQKLQPVGKAINQMVEEFSDILGNVQAVTQAVEKHARDVQHSSDLLARDANQQERQVQHISHAIDEIAGTMTQLSNSASELSRVVLEAVDVTLDGQSAVDRAVEGMSQVREATTLSARIMKRLGENGQEINETNLAITDLTTRMNLVALNAAIEATRAGEVGHGFVVIAQEIRSLALSSSEAAKKVASHIRAIQRETTAISQSVEHNTLEAVKQTELVTQTGVAFDAISVVTEQMAGLVQGISVAADNQAQNSQQVASAVEQIALMTSEITLHMHHMKQSLAQLAELTNSLQSRMTVFRVGDR